MASRPQSLEITLRIQRTFAAPRAEVFNAWTDPEALKRWWGPAGYDTPSAAVDLRVGGRYRLGMRKLPDGEVFYLTGIYHVVQPPEKLVYTWSWESNPEHGETLVTVEFHDRGGVTDVLLLHERFRSEHSRQEHSRGWAGCLERLTGAL